MSSFPAPRTCKVCNKGMWEGYLFEEVGETFCSDECLHTEVTPEEMAQYYLDDVGYWTKWEEEEKEEQF